MHHQTLLRTLPIVAVMLGRRAGVEVVVGGDKAETNGKKIILPSVDPADPNAEVLSYAYLGHEIGHVCHTDFERLNRVKWTPLKKALHNTFEDIYTEKETGKTYPGVRSDIACLVDSLVNDGTFKAACAEDHPSAVLQRYLLYRMRTEILGQESLRELAEQAEGVFRRTVSEGLAAKVGAVIARARAMTSTKDALALAENLIAVLDEEKANQDNQEGPEAAPGENTAGPDTASTPDSQQSQEKTSDRKTPAELSAVASQILDAADGDLDKDLGQLLQDRLDDMAEAAQRTGAGGTGAGVGVADPPEQLLVDPSALLASARGATNALRVRLGSFVEAYVDEDETYDTAGMSLDSMSLQRAMRGQRDVFRHVSEDRGIDTAVVILFDRSGSMRSRMQVAKEASLAISLAMKEIPGVSVATAAFPSHYTADGVLPLTCFGETPLATAGRYEALSASGGTPMTEAIWYAAHQLAQRDEPRKLILVVTDGQPNDRNSCAKAIQVVGNCGVEIMGLGISTDSVTDLFPVSATVQEIGELAPAMFQMLQSALLKAAA